MSELFDSQSFSTISGCLEWLSVNLVNTGQATITANNTTLNKSANTTMGLSGTMIAQNTSISGYFASRPTYVQFNTASITWAQPAAVNFFNAVNVPIAYLDLSHYTGIQLTVNKLATAGSTTGALYLGYNTIYSQTASTYSRIDSNNTEIKIGFANIFQNSGWQPITNNAKSGVFVALISSGGNPAVSPIFGMINVGLM